MNVKRLILLACIGLIAVSGCSQKKNITSGTSQTNSGGSQAQSISEGNASKQIEISDADFSVVGMALSIPIYGEIENVIQRLGKPLPVVAYNNKDDPESSILGYKWGSIYIEWLKKNGTILRMIIDGKGFKSKRGVEVGDPITKIDSLYGPNTGHRNNDQIEFDLGNEENESMMALVFYIKNGAVNKIEITQDT